MSLQPHLKQFSQEGIAKVPNKDVCVCSKQLVAVCTRLTEIDALPQESNGFILERLTRCSVPEFKDIHRLLCTTHKVCQMRAVTGRRDSSTTLAHIQKICKEACEVFHSMNLTNKWNIPQSHQADAFLTTCYNCGAPDHTSNKCSLPRNEANIRPRRHVLSLSRKGMVVVAVVMVVEGKVKAVIVPILGTNGVSMAASQLLKMINLQLIESRRKTERG